MVCCLYRLFNFHGLACGKILFSDVVVIDVGRTPKRVPLAGFDPETNLVQKVWRIWRIWKNLECDIWNVISKSLEKVNVRHIENRG